MENIQINFLELLITLTTAFIASSGFWLFIERRTSGKDLSRKLLIGLAHDRIVYLSLKYIERGSISQDEYENLCEFLCKPYTELGGNGTTKRLMAEVDRLPIMNNILIKNRIEEVKNVP